MWTNVSMAKRLDFEKRRFDNKRTLNVKDESEFRGKDLAARWIANAEAELADKKARRAQEQSRRAKQELAKPITTTRKSSWQGKKLAPGEAPF